MLAGMGLARNGRPRNDVAQYDELVTTWWDPRGRLAMLHWLAAARAALVPPPGRPGAVLVDVACGGGLMAPHLVGYRHLGVDVSASALAVAAGRGMHLVRGDARALPFASGSADVVVAGEVLEHVPGLARVVAELCRILRPGGALVLDSIAATRRARLVAVTLAERIPGGPPPRLHEPSLFVDRSELVRECARHGVTLRLTGLRLSALDYLGWLTGRRAAARLVPTRSTAVLFCGTGTKERP